MDEKYEVLLTGDSSGQTCNTSAWDPTTGSCLHQWKGGASVPRSVCMIGEDYLVSGQPSKPLLNVWQVNRSEQMPLRLFTPGPVSSLATSPSGSYLAAAVQESITIWQLGTGALLAVLSRHYQPVTVLSFTKDGSHLISGGEDGQVLVWPLVTCLARRSLPGHQVGQPEPRFTFSDHSLAVTALHCGYGPAPLARVFTASLDQVCRVYSLTRGEQLLAVSFTSPLTSLAVDAMESTVYVGSQSGTISHFSLQSPPREVAVTADSLQATSIEGHSSSVTVLSLSMDGRTLASGAEGEVKLWDTPSAQCIRSLPHKGTVVTVQFMPTPPSLIDRDRWQPARKLVALQKGSQQGGEFSCSILRREDLQGRDWDEEAVSGGGQADTKEVGEHTVEELKDINNQLYKFALKNILKT